jgi:hypothetical protein
MAEELYLSRLEQGVPIMEVALRNFVRPGCIPEPFSLVVQPQQAADMATEITKGLGEQHKLLHLHQDARLAVAIAR